MKRIEQLDASISTIFLGMNISSYHHLLIYHLVYLIWSKRLAMQARHRGFRVANGQVIRKMDDHFGISADATTAVLSHQLDTERQLDIQILYLRRVHHFCFYSGKWCKDSDSVFCVYINVVL